MERTSIIEMPTPGLATNAVAPSGVTVNFVRIAADGTRPTTLPDAGRRIASALAFLQEHEQSRPVWFVCAGRRSQWSTATEDHRQANRRA
jgi:hypothetical protein